MFFKLDNNQLLYKSNNHSFCSFHKMVSNMFSSALFLVEYPIGSMGLVFLRTFTIGSMHGIFSHIYNLTSTNWTIPKNHGISKLVVWRSQAPAIHIQTLQIRRVQWFLGMGFTIQINQTQRDSRIFGTFFPRVVGWWGLDKHPVFWWLQDLLLGSQAAEEDGV